MADGIEQPGGLFLPDATADAVLAHLIYLDAYPGLCQQAIDEYAGVVAARGTATLEIEQAKHRADVMNLEAEIDGGWHWYHVAGIAAGALAFGYLAGRF